MAQFGSGVSGLSSSGIGFNQSSFVLTFRRWATPVSSESEICASSGIRMSLTGSKNREAYFFEELEDSKLELLCCQMFSKLMTADLEAVVKQRHQNLASFFCFGQSPLEVEDEDLDHHGVSYEIFFCCKELLLVVPFNGYLQSLIKR
nr:hypothetical protein [Tanacetum cinerariifolium]